MITIKHSVKINKPINEVFSYVADGRNDPAWCPPVKEVEQVAGSGPENGAKYKLVSKPGPVPLKGTFEILNLIADTMVEYEGGNVMINFDYRYEFTKESDDTTTVRMISNLHPKGIWKILTPIIRSDSRKVAKEEFENLKEILEGK